MTDNKIIPLDKAPIEQLNKEQVEATVRRLRVTVPAAKDMSTEQLAHIAQMSILTRTMPGRDRHYFVDKRGNLKESDDYKAMKAWAEYRERYITGDNEATFEDSYPELTPEDRIREHLKDDGLVAVYCLITTKRDRDRFREEVKAWMDLSYPADKAVAMARSILGDIGTKAIGVVNPREFEGGKDIPSGWSIGQVARKRALKAAIRQKWGQPSIDELHQMALAMARIETTSEDWDNVPLDEPMQIQAQYAELEALAREATEEAEEMTIEQHRERLEERNGLLHGNGNDDPIGDDEPGVIDGQAEEVSEPVESEPAPEPAQPAEPVSQVKAEDIPRKPADFLAFINRRVVVTYDSEYQLLGGISKQLGRGKPGAFPSVKNDAEWLVYYQAATDYAKSKEQPAEAE